MQKASGLRSRLGDNASSGPGGDADPDAIRLDGISRQTRLSKPNSSCGARRQKGHAARAQLPITSQPATQRVPCDCVVGSTPSARPQNPQDAHLEKLW